MRTAGSIVAATAALLLAAIAPALATAATIGGTVTEAAGSQAPLEGVSVCPEVQPYTFETGCTTTDSGGHYLLEVPYGTYTLRFDDTVRNRNVISESYGGSPYFPGTTVTVGAGAESVVADAQLEPGSTITGTVTDAVSGLGIEGIPVCAIAEHGLEGTTGRCETSGPGGTYVVNGLPPGEYKVEFQSGSLNYLEQRYDDSVWPQPITFVPISAAGEIIPSIDAVMQVGAEIDGRVTDAATGVGLPGISVEAVQVEDEANRIVKTGASGEYSLRGLPEGEYRIAFATNGSQSLGTCYESLHYGDSSTGGVGTPLHAVPGTALTRIDAALTRACELPRSPSSTKAPSSKHRSALLRATHRHGRACRKGTVRRRVHRKTRCVKVGDHRRRHRHRRKGSAAPSGRDASDRLAQEV